MIVRYAHPESAIYAAGHPEHAGLNRTGIFLGQAVDALNWLVWAQTKDGRRNANRPKSVLPANPKNKKRAKVGATPGSHPTPTPLSKLKSLLPGRNLTARERKQRLAAALR